MRPPFLLSIESGSAGRPSGRLPQGHFEGGFESSFRERSHGRVVTGMMYDEAILPRLESLARQAAESEGVEVAHVELKRHTGNWMLRVYIDRPAAGESGVSLDDCRRVSERLSVLLDVEDPIESSYTLEVSSPGLDRPLWSEQDYVRFAGRAARVQTREPIEGRYRFRGQLAGVAEDAVLLDEDGRRVVIPLNAIASGRLEVELFRGRRVGRRS